MRPDWLARLVMVVAYDWLVFFGVVVLVLCYFHRESRPPGHQWDMSGVGVTTSYLYNLCETAREVVVMR